MTLLALGLNHHTAPVEVRERAAIAETDLPQALRDLQRVQAVNEAAIVSTCNRTEVYCGVRRNDPSIITAWMRDWTGLPGEDTKPYLFHHADVHAVTHLMRVASGLDSLVLGEPQILGQIKLAYRNAESAGTLGSELSPLFQTAFSVAKQVRTETAIGANPVSVAFAAVSLARQIFADFSRHTALLIGAGETVQLAARHLKGAGIGRVIVANRTLERAETVASEFNGQAIALGAIPAHLHDADIVISSTASPLPIIGKGTVSSALKKRKQRTMLFVDIAVPRDIEPEVGDIDAVFLYTVDDLSSVIEENRQSREAAALEAEDIVTHEAQQFMQKMQALTATDTIRDYRQSVELLRDQMLAKSIKQLNSGQPAEQVLEQLAHGLANKVMHAPTAQLRQSAAEGKFDVLRIARTILGLSKRDGA